MNPRSILGKKKRIVVKIGTSSLTYPNGRLNFFLIERVAKVLSEINNAERQLLLVSSGAIAVGSATLSFEQKPTHLDEKQAFAAIGQTGLMKIYQLLFEKFDQFIAQILLTKDAMLEPTRRQNAKNTFSRLLEMGIIPIINENDAIATEEIEFGDNDTLSAYVADLVDADLLVMLSDIDGLYNDDPRNNPNAQIIPLVEDINPAIEKLAGSKGSSFGTGGMVTKIEAAKICKRAYIDTIITNGENPEILFDILKGKEIGTLFYNSKK